MTFRVGPNYWQPPKRTLPWDAAHGEPVRSPRVKLHGVYNSFSPMGLEASRAGFPPNDSR